MKKNAFTLFFAFLLISCSNNGVNDNCNFLVNAGVDFTVNLNLPQFSDLQFPSNSVYVPNQGNGGVIVTNAGSGIVAWDAADPNHAFSNCSVMGIVGGINAKCNCIDENEYSLITGQSLGDPLPCALKPYRVQEGGNNTYIITN